MARPVKKSESLEIRIPYATKAAFMARCRTEGASASETLRGFIEAHLERDRPRASRGSRHTAVRVAAGLTAALGLAATALPSLARPLERAQFDSLDSDRDGRLNPAEVGRAASVSVRIGGAGLGGAGLVLEGAETGELRGLIVRQAFVRLDRDADGAVSFAEFRRR
jgi:hypothetical protein